MAANGKDSSAAAIHTASIFVSGKVQGVFYRKYTRAAGAQIGVTGWVRNLPDGRVEIMAEGTESQLAQLQQWCHKGSPSSRVAGVQLLLIPAAAVGTEGGPSQPSPAAKTAREFKSFDVRH